MNPAIMVAIMAATQQQEQEDKAEAKLREAKALGASSAIDFAPANDAEQKWLDKAVAEGIVVRTASGRVYLSERRLADRWEGQGFTVLLVMLVVASLIASGIALVMTASG